MSRYLHRLQTLMQFVESHLDEPLNLDQLCAQVHLSKFHLHRQCTLLLGVSLMSFVRHLRMKRAAYQLAYREQLSVTHIALECGYEHAEAFSRAFKHATQQSPTEFRTSPDWLLWSKGQDAIFQCRRRVMKKEHAYVVEIIEFPQLELAVKEHLGSPKTLGATIREFIAWRKSQGLSPSVSRTFNFVYSDPMSTPEDEFQFDLGCERKHASIASNDQIISKTIPAGKCAKIRHVGSDAAMSDAIRFLYEEWLENSDFELRDFPLFLERISFFPDVSEQEMITEIFLPIH